MSTEYETEKEGVSTHSRSSSHVKSSVQSNNDSFSHEFNDTDVREFTGTVFEQSDLVSDATLAKSNIASILHSVLQNNYGNQFVKEPESHAEKNYQMSLLSTPESHRYYIGNAETSDPMRSDMLMMMLMIILLVVIAIVLHTALSTVSKNAEADDVVIYKITSRSINADPYLSQHRFL
jgi:hypothetical protein